MALHFFQLKVEVTRSSLSVIVFVLYSPSYLVQPIVDSLGRDNLRLLRPILYEENSILITPIRQREGRMKVESIQLAGVLWIMRQWCTTR